MVRTGYVDSSSPRRTSSGLCRPFAILLAIPLTSRTASWNRSTNTSSRTPSSFNNTMNCRLRNAYEKRETCKREAIQTQEVKNTATTTHSDDIYTLILGAELFHGLPEAILITHHPGPDSQDALGPADPDLNRRRLRIRTRIVAQGSSSCTSHAS